MQSSIPKRADNYIFYFDAKSNEKDAIEGKLFVRDGVPQ
jgi:hypothetical protein